MYSYDRAPGISRPEAVGSVGGTEAAEGLGSSARADHGAGSSRTGAGRTGPPHAANDGARSVSAAVVGGTGDAPDERLMTDDTMSSALAEGTARPLSRFVTDFVSYDGRWWLLTTQGWLRIDDAGLLAVLDRPGRWIAD